MYWQLFLPVLMAITFISCSSSVNSEYIQEEKIIKNETYYANEIIYASNKWKKTPYRLGGTSIKKGADCSYFVKSIYSEVYKIQLPRTTKQQLSLGKIVKKTDLKAGDLVFFRTGGPNGLHVGIYLYDKKFIHLSSSGGSKIQSLDLKYWKSRYYSARRISAK